MLCWHRVSANPYVIYEAPVTPIWCAGVFLCEQGKFKVRACIRLGDCRNNYKEFVNHIESVKLFL